MEFSFFYFQFILSQKFGFFVAKFNFNNANVRLKFKRDEIKWKITQLLCEILFINILLRNTVSLERLKKKRLKVKRRMIFPKKNTF